MNPSASPSPSPAAPKAPTAATPRRGKAATSSRRTKRPCSASTLGHKTSAEANRRAAVILEVLAGERLPSEAAGVLGVSVTHYYLLERKALEGLAAACEARPKGRSTPTAEQQVARLNRDLERSQRECQRQAALVRATQRAVGLPASSVAPDAAKKSSRTKKNASSSRKRPRRRRPTVRALRAAEALGKNSSLPNGPRQLQPSLAGDSAGSPPVAQEER